jgi:hypothetical protein
MSKVFWEWRCRRMSSPTVSTGAVSDAVEIIAKQAALNVELIDELRGSAAMVSRLLVLNNHANECIQYWKDLAESRAEVYELVETQPVNHWVN